MDEGKLWSLIRNVLSQGGAIQLDRASMSSYEEYSARLDAAAAERVADFTKLADARIAELESEVARLKSKVNATFDSIKDHTSRAAAKRVFAEVKKFDEARAGNGGGV